MPTILLPAEPTWASMTAHLVGLPVSHVWQGAGSALFLEFGALRPRFRRDGSPRNPDGEMGLMVEWGWRIEGRRSILCGSDSDERTWPRAWALLRRAAVARVGLLGHLPEIELVLSNGARVLSFRTTSGDPDWTLFDRREPDTRWVTVRRGVLIAEADVDALPA